MVLRLTVVVACLLAVAGVALTRRADDPAVAAHPAPVLLGAYVSPDGRHWDEDGVTAL